MRQIKEWLQRRIYILTDLTPLDFSEMVPRVRRAAYCVASIFVLYLCFVIFSKVFPPKLLSQLALFFTVLMGLFFLIGLVKPSVVFMENRWFVLLFTLGLAFAVYLGGQVHDVAKAAEGETLTGRELVRDSVTNYNEEDCAELKKFQNSSFYKSNHPVDIDDPYILKNGGIYYSFKYPGSSIYFKCDQGVIKEFGLIWRNPRGLAAPLEWNSSIESFTMNFVDSLISSKNAKLIVDYLKSKQRSDEPDGVGNIPMIMIGDVKVAAGTTGGELILVIDISALAQITSINAKKPSPVVVGDLADTVLELRGKPLSIKQVGRDWNGLLVEWEYQDAIYVLGRRLQDDIEAYRVVEITPHK